MTLNKIVTDILYVRMGSRFNRNISLGKIRQQKPHFTNYLRKLPGTIADIKRIESLERARRNRHDIKIKAFVIDSTESFLQI